MVRFVASGLVDLRDLLLGVDLRLPSGFEPYVVEHPASAGPSELQDGEVLTIGVRLSSSVPFVSAGALSSVAPVEVTPAPSSAAASGSTDYPVAVVQSIWFAVFKPDHLPELVQCEVDFPASVSEAAEMLALARDRVTSSLYPHLIAADPQPCLEFGCFLGRPDWARDKIQVLVDSRPWDGRLFTIFLDPWLQWGSFLCFRAVSGHTVCLLSTSKTRQFPQVGRLCWRMVPWSRYYLHNAVLRRRCLLLLYAPARAHVGGCYACFFLA